MVRAVQLEARYLEAEILALYLTLAPYGGNLEGVRAASLSYFGHEPETLTLGEQALLIALPQSPEVRRPDRNPAEARAARHLVLAADGRGATGDAGRGRTRPTPNRLPARAAFPALAWHATGQLARAAPVGQATVVSTLDATLQSRLEPLAAAYAREQGAEATAAIMVVEIKGRAVRALVGSGGLDRPGGWIDMTLAPALAGLGAEAVHLRLRLRRRDRRARHRDRRTSRPASPTISRRISTACSAARSRPARPCPIR